jgi:hypothetical protein
MFANSAENNNKTKRLKTPDEVEKYFPGFLAFIFYKRTTDTKICE